MGIVKKTILMNFVLLTIFFSYLYYVVNYTAITKIHLAVLTIIIIGVASLNLVLNREAKQEYNKEVEKKTQEIMKNMR